MIVFTEASSQHPPSASLRDIQAMTETARLVGCRVYTIPVDFERCADAEGALWHVPHQDTPQPGWWIGYIPAPERYTAIYNAALTRNIQLLNTPEHYQRVMEFDQAYPALVGLTPRTVMVQDVSEVPAAIEDVGLPAFIKGAIQSQKGQGKSACVAADLNQAETLVARLLKHTQRSRGRVAVRQFVSLKHERTGPRGMPLGREYRLFLHHAQCFALGYYWEGHDPLAQLSPSEHSDVVGLAQDAARRLNVPLVSVDVGQLERGDWIVIETGDPQFSGISQIPRLELWNAIQSLHL